MLAGLLGHAAVNPVVAWAYRHGHQHLLASLAVDPLPYGATQDSRLEYSLAGQVRPEPGSLRFDQRQLRLTFSRAWLALLLLVVGVSCLRSGWHRRAAALLQEEAAPLTLGIFRIVVFATLLARFNLHRWLWFATIPQVLAEPPPGLHFMIEHGLVSAGALRVLSPLFILFLVLALIGLFTRFSAAMAVALGLYIWGIPKIFGATMYQHGLFWFAAMCAAGPSGEALSVDALLRAWRRPLASLEAARRTSRLHGVTGRLIWFLFAVMYFFPGFWKLWNCGLDWAGSTNLIGLMHARWYDYQKVSGLRLDHWPWLCTVGAAQVLAFELGFVFTLVFPRARRLALAEAAGFHVMNLVVLHIDFMYMVYCYVIFFDMRAALGRLGRRLFGPPLVLRFEPGALAAVRLVALLEALDVFQALEPTADPRLAHGATLVAGTERSGKVAFWAGLVRVPLAWPLTPALAFAAARLERREVAGSVPSPRVAGSRRVVVLTGALILLGGSVAGALELDQGWPFACYPPFGWLAGPRRHELHVRASAADGTPLPYDEKVLVPWLSGNWLAQLSGFVLLTEEPSLREQRLRAFWQLMVQVEPRLRAARRVEMESREVDLNPTPAPTVLAPVRTVAVFDVAERFSQGSIK